jgi:excisionase family DNA binding protein
MEFDFQPPAPTMKRLLTIKEASALLGISRTTIYELTHVERLRTVRIGKSIRIPIEALDDFIAAATAR